MFEKDAKGHEEHAPIMEVLRNYKPQLAIAFFARLGGDIAFYVFTLFLLYYVPTKLGLPKSVALNAVLIGAVAQIIFIPVAGGCRTGIGRRPVLMIGGIGGAVWAFAFTHLVQTGSPTAIMLASFVGMVLVHSCLAARLLPARTVRHARCAMTGASRASSSPACSAGAGPADRHGPDREVRPITPVAIYLAIVCALIAVAAFAARETAHIDLKDAGTLNRRLATENYDLETFDTVIRNGTVVTACDTMQRDIGMRGGRIAALGEGLAAGARRSTPPAAGASRRRGRPLPSRPADARGPCAWPTTSSTGTRSAACGGTTTVIPFAAQAKGHSLRAAVADYHRRADGQGVHRLRLPPDRVRSDAGRCCATSCPR